MLSGPARASEQPGLASPVSSPRRARHHHDVVRRRARRATGEGAVEGKVPPPAGAPCEWCVEAGASGKRARSETERLRNARDASSNHRKRRGSARQFGVARDSCCGLRSCSLRRFQKFFGPRQRARRLSSPCLPHLERHLQTRGVPCHSELGGEGVEHATARHPSFSVISISVFGEMNADAARRPDVREHRLARRGVRHLDARPQQRPRRAEVVAYLPAHSLDIGVRSWVGWWPGHASSEQQRREQSNVSQATPHDCSTHRRVRRRHGLCHDPTDALAARPRFCPATR